MKRTRMISIPFVIIATFVACTTPQEESESNSASEDVERIHQISVAIDSAYATGDGIVMAELVTEDVICMPPEEPTIIGREEVEKRYTNMFGELRSRFKDINHTLELDEVLVFDDWAILRGRWRLEMTLIEVSRSVVITGKNTHTYRRQPDGHWLIARNIWNNDAPVRRGAE